MMAGNSMVDLERVEIYRDEQKLMLKKCDVTVTRLSKVFKVFNIKT